MSVLSVFFGVSVEMRALSVFFHVSVEMRDVLVFISISIEMRCSLSKELISHKYMNFEQCENYK
jgi:hypothetical protein